MTIFIAVLLALYTAKRFGENREEQFFVRFNSAGINEIVDYSAIGYHGSVFKIEDIEEEFVFYPFTSDINNNQIFYHIAKKGDLIVKHAYSDTLRLVKEDKIYLYKFRKPR